MKTDLEIQKDVMEELKWESFIKSSDIGVSVSNGVVTLSGFVDTFSKKRLAENVALRVGGVKAVAEDIVVKFSTDNKITDTDIAQAVLNALRWNSIIPEEKIKVKVEDGWVTTKGEVDWTFEKSAIRLAIENIIGVKGLSNLVTINPKVKVSVPDIKGKITAAFHRNATLDANNIVVGGVGSKVILRGTVRSYAEKQDAEHAAWNAPGITEIENRLEVIVPVMADDDQVFI